MATRSFVSTPFGMAATSQKTKSTKLAGKKIVQILPALNHGGVERGTVEMAEAIIKPGRGHSNWKAHMARHSFSHPNGI